MSKRAIAELFGTFWLVFEGCGSAVLAAAYPTLGIGFVCVSLAFGLTVVSMAFAIGHVSGAHLNLAVSIGLVVGKRFSIVELPAYIIAQVLGVIAGSGVLYVIASGKPEFSLAGGFASNGCALHSPGGYSLLACFVAEVVLTTFFLLIILGATDERAPKGFAPLAIGLSLTLIHLISIPVTNTSVNPARSTGPAIFVGGWALHQLWLFWVAPILGTVLGGLAPKSSLLLRSSRYASRWRLARPFYAEKVSQSGRRNRSSCYSQETINSYPVSFLGVAHRRWVCSVGTSPYLVHSVRKGLCDEAERTKFG